MKDFMNKKSIQKSCWSVRQLQGGIQKKKNQN